MIDAGQSKYTYAGRREKRNRTRKRVQEKAARRIDGKRNQTVRQVETERQTGRQGSVPGERTKGGREERRG
jgi:hypothetical protein